MFSARNALAALLFAIVIQKGHSVVTCNLVTATNKYVTVKKTGECGADTTKIKNALEADICTLDLTGSTPKAVRAMARVKTWTTIDLQNLAECAMTAAELLNTADVNLFDQILTNYSKPEVCKETCFTKKTEKVTFCNTEPKGCRKADFYTKSLCEAECFKGDLTGNKTEYCKDEFNKKTCPLYCFHGDQGGIDTGDKAKFCGCSTSPPPLNPYDEILKNCLSKTEAEKLIEINKEKVPKGIKPSEAAKLIENAIKERNKKIRNLACNMIKAPLLSSPAPENTPPGNTPPGNTPPGNTPPGNTPPGNTPPGNTPPGNSPITPSPPSCSEKQCEKAFPGKCGTGNNIKVHWIGMFIWICSTVLFL